MYGDWSIFSLVKARLNKKVLNQCLLNRLMSPKYFGGLCVLPDVPFQLNEGEITGRIGPNGAGKASALSQEYTVQMLFARKRKTER